MRQPRRKERQHGQGGQHPGAAPRDAPSLLGHSLGITPPSFPRALSAVPSPPQAQAWVPVREPQRPSVFNLLRARQVGRNGEERGAEVAPSVAVPAQGSAPAPHPQSDETQAESTSKRCHPLEQREPGSPSPHTTGSPKPVLSPVPPCTFLSIALSPEQPCRDPSLQLFPLLALKLLLFLGS